MTEDHTPCGIRSKQLGKHINGRSSLLEKSFRKAADLLFLFLRIARGSFCRSGEEYPGAVAGRPMESGGHLSPGLSIGTGIQDLIIPAGFIILIILKLSIPILDLLKSLKQAVRLERNLIIIKLHDLNLLPENADPVQIEKRHILIRYRKDHRFHIHQPE